MDDTDWRRYLESAFDPIFRVQTSEQQLSLSLPALFELLGKNVVDHYEGLQKHQHDAFHVFLCYLAGAVLARTNCQDPVQNEEFWRNGLLRLAGRYGKDAWELVAEDISCPAFSSLQYQMTIQDHRGFVQGTVCFRQQSKYQERWHKSPMHGICPVSPRLSGFLGKGNQGSRE